MQIYINRETSILDDAVPNFFFVRIIVCDSILTLFCLVDTTKRRRRCIPNDSFHLKSAWCCVVESVSLLINANLLKCGS